MEKKYLCLSFDDGPNLDGADNCMERMLDILDKYKIPASFFLIGNKITENNKKIIMRAVKMGCDIQNHSWTHPWEPSMADMEIDGIIEEFQKCDDAIFELTGKRPDFFRPPFIKISQKMYDAIPLPFICGDGCCFDWEPERTADFRYKALIDNAKNGLIYLLHVLEGNQNTLDALDKAIPELLQKGYEFVNLPDLFKNMNVNPKIKNSLWSLATGPEGNTWSK